MSGRKKSTNSRSSTSKRGGSSRRVSRLSPEMIIILMLLVGVMLGVIIYTGAGQIGAVLNPLLGGLVGIIKYIIPIGVIVTGISLMREDSNYVTTKLTQFIIFIVCVAVVMQGKQQGNGDKPFHTFAVIVNTCCKSTKIINKSICYYYFYVYYRS